MAQATGFDYLTAFDSAASEILVDLLGESPVKGSPEAHFGGCIPLPPVSIAVGITGALSGHFRLGMDESTALAIAGNMLGEDVAELDEMAVSALCELTNMIAGSARSNLNQGGAVSDITPPSVLRGEDSSETWPNIRALSIPLNLAMGTLHLTVGIRFGAKPEVQP